eukprot:1157864-Pelagomonas_calceolata.AAC.3
MIASKTAPLGPKTFSTQLSRSTHATKLSRRRTVQVKALGFDFGRDYEESPPPEIARAKSRTNAQLHGGIITTIMQAPSYHEICCQPQRGPMFAESSSHVRKYLGRTARITSIPAKASSLLVLAPTLRGSVAEAFLAAIAMSTKYQARHIWQFNATNKDIIAAYSKFYGLLLQAGYDSWMDYVLDQMLPVKGEPGPWMTTFFLDKA